MTRVVEPPLEVHGNLRQPMTAGERAVFNLFDRCLSPEWEIYIQPHLNGLRPDFVLLHPRVGIAVFEVKDWNLDAMRYYAKTARPGRVTLWADNGSRSFSIESKNPFTAAARYKERIFNLYCPRLQGGHGFAAITAGVIFPNADANRVRRLQAEFLSDQEKEHSAVYWPVSGQAELANDDLATIFPESKRTSSGLMRPELADDFRGWLVEPDFSAEQRKPLALDARQRELVDTRTKSGFRRIKGAAGSGKSLVLAARAARLISEGKSVLLVTFNITLWHYLRDLIVRGANQRGDMDNIEFTHFHDWCKDVCLEAGLSEEYDGLFAGIRKIEESDVPDGQKAKLIGPLRDDVLNRAVPALAMRAALSPEVKHYDAIMVDEAQDFRPLWWNALRNCRATDGEMLLAADSMQDVYGTARSWTDEAMHGAGFTGDWSRLDVSYRLPQRAQVVAEDFARRFLPKDTIDLPAIRQDSLEIEPCHLNWVQCPPDEAGKHCVDAVLAMMRETGKNGLANADITFICNDIEFGKTVVETLETYSDGDTPIRSAHTFDADERESKRRKMAFYMGDARIKATTLLSFKGWESRLLVVHVGHADGETDMASIYAALTRLKRSTEGSWLTVVCSAPELRRYGMSWSETGSAPSSERPTWSDIGNGLRMPINHILSSQDPSHVPADPGPSPSVPPTIIPVETSLPIYGVKADSVPHLILAAVRSLLGGTSIEIEDVGHNQYQEAYYFRRDGVSARVNVSYKANGKVTSLAPAKPSAFADEIIGMLDPITKVALTASGSGNGRVGIGSFSRPFLDDFHARLSTQAAARGFRIAEAAERSWCQRYSFTRGADFAVIDAFYDGHDVFTTIQPVTQLCNSMPFLREVLEMVDGGLGR